MSEIKIHPKIQAKYEQLRGIWPEFTMTEEALSKASLFDMDMEFIYQQSTKNDTQWRLRTRLYPEGDGRVRVETTGERVPDPEKESP